MLSAFLNLPTSQKAKALEIALLLYYYKIYLSAFPFSKVLTMVDRLQNSLDKAWTPSLSREIVYTLVDRISKRLPGCDNCMIRSLTALRLSGGYEKPPIFKIGVRISKTKKIIGSEQENSFSAHAWLETKQGKVVFEETPDLSKYRVLESLAN